MSQVKVSGNASGTGVFEIAAPNSNSNYTLTLPTATTTLVGTDATQTLTNKTLTTPNFDSAQVATVSGTAPLYMCRAWVCFDGTKDTSGSASTANTNRLILASGNVTSVLRNSAGNYTVTYTVAMPDANYAVCGSCQDNNSSGSTTFSSYSRTASSIVIVTATTGTDSLFDSAVTNVVFFR